MPENTPTFPPRPRQTAVAIWLLLCCLAIYGMVVLGGVTRLTGSGLSMVDWRPITGALPPLDAEQWEQTFALYRESPEFQKVNHAMDLDALRADPNVTFWSFWDAGNLLGCGALKVLDGQSAEIKSMRTVQAHRRRGVGALILEHIIATARERRLTTLFLETGSMAEFAPARALYERYGFEYCRPFADYAEDPNSVFMTRRV